MDYIDHIRILKAAEAAGIVRFEGGEVSAYGGKPSAEDHTKAYWRTVDVESLAKFLEFYKETT